VICNRGSRFIFELLEIYYDISILLGDEDNCAANKKGIVILYVFFRLMLFFLLVVLRFFPEPVFLFEVAFAFCDGLGLGLGLGFAGLLVGDTSLLVVLTGPGGVEDSDIF
jgi:hypothetical protein